MLGPQWLRVQTQGGLVRLQLLGLTSPSVKEMGWGVAILTS